MKRGKKLLAMLAALVLIICVFVLVTALNPNDTDESGTAYQTVFKLDPEKVTNIAWNYSDAVSFTKTENGWVNDADSVFPADKAVLEAMLKALTEVGASKTIENPEDLDQYGLQYPFCSITVTADGTTYNLAIGDQNSFNGERYFSMGDGNVYMVKDEIAANFNFGPEGVLLMETIPEMSDITALKVTTKSRSYEIVYEKDSDKAYSSHYTWFMDDKILDTENTLKLLSVLQDLEWRSCPDYNATDLTQYGLDAPEVVATVTYSGTTFVLELGKEVEKGVYARLAGSNMVYLVDDDVLDALKDTTYNDLIPNEVLLMDWETVTSMDIAVDGKTYTLTCEEEADENGCSTGNYIWKLNGTKVEGSKITDAFADIEVIHHAVGQEHMDEKISFVFHRNTANFTTIELVIYEFSSEAFLVTFNGESTVLADKTDVQSLVNAVNKIVTAAQ